jgi:hypothetical protein
MKRTLATRFNGVAGELVQRRSHRCKLSLDPRLRTPAKLDHAGAGEGAAGIRIVRVARADQRHRR